MISLGPHNTPGAKWGQEGGGRTPGHPLPSDAQACVLPGAESGALAPMLGSLS